MILILIALVTVFAGSIYCHLRGRDYSFFDAVVCPVMTVIAAIVLFAYAILAWHWMAANYKKDIINREYKTNYTQEEVFYASDVINTIRELNRSRIEINGNLITGENKK